MCTGCDFFGAAYVRSASARTEWIDQTYFDLLWCFGVMLGCEANPFLDTTSPVSVSTTRDDRHPHVGQKANSASLGVAKSATRPFRGRRPLGPSGSGNLPTGSHPTPSQGIWRAEHTGECHSVRVSWLSDAMVDTQLHATAPFVFRGKSRTRKKQHKPNGRPP